MEALDSPSQVNIENAERSNMFDSENKEGEYINESRVNKELERDDDDDKVVHQNNTNLELQKQKLILNNSLHNKEVNERHPVSLAHRRDTTDSSYIAAVEEQGSRMTPNSDESTTQNKHLPDDSPNKLELENSYNTAVFDAEKVSEHDKHTEKLDVLNDDEKSDCNVKTSFLESATGSSGSDVNTTDSPNRSENVSEHDTDTEKLNVLNEGEKSDCSVKTSFLETATGSSGSDVNTTDSSNRSENVSDAINLEKDEDGLLSKQPVVEAEASTVNNTEYNQDTQSYDVDLESNFEKSDNIDLHICSPKVNGNHKETYGSSCDSSQQEDFTEEQPEEKETLDGNNETDQNKSVAEILQNIIIATDNAVTTYEDEKPKEDNDAVPPENSNVDQNRCSSPDSVCSSSTTCSSSSQQLVIDQPLDEEKISPLRVSLKRKHGKGNTKKRGRFPKEVSSNTTPDVLKSSISSILQNVEENEISKLLNVELSKIETKHAFSFAPTSLSEPKNLNEENVNDSAVQDAVQSTYMEQSPSKSGMNLSLESPKSISDSPNVLDLHPRRSPSYISNPPNYFKCISCGSYHENWSFFLHIREEHDRFLCLYCIKSFPTAEKLSLHLEIKHDLEQNHFNSEEAFRSSAAVINGYALETRFLMCCTCQHVFGEKVAFTEHVCTEYMKSCVLCGQKGRHTNQCKAHPFVKRRNKKKVKEKQSEQESPSTSSLINIQEEVSPQCPTTLPKPITHNEESNSSSNMVIDESCTINHSISGKINAFNAPEESEFAEKPYDTRQETFPQQSIEEPSTNFLKFKLRVPKEFQKPVDAAISSSESDDGVYEEEPTEERNSELPAQDIENSNSGKPRTEPLCDTENNDTVTSAYHDEMSKIERDEESVDEDDTNPHLARILQEIEQTKLDIQRTKETIHHAHAQKVNTAPSEIEPEKSCSPNQKNNKNLPSPQPVDGSPKRNWTPTPPASPKISDSTHENKLLTDELTAEEFNATKEDSKIDASNDELQSEKPVNEIQKQNSSFEGDSSGSFTNAEKTNTSEPNVQNSFVNELHQEDGVNTMQLQNEKSETQELPPSDGIEIANEDCLIIEIQLDRPLEKFEAVEFVRTCLKAAYPFCLYCNHARRIAVNGESLVLHLIAQHRFSATVDSITAEELLPETIVAKLKSFLPQLQNEYFNTNSYCTIGAGAFTRHFNERIFECFQCRFVTTTHKELYLHNRKMHLRTAILCFMCRCNFFSFSEILCHICPGIPHKVSIFEIKFRCCLCDLDNIPSPFRLMVHLRKRHFACDICLEDCRDQSKLSSHVWKHKLHHLCYRCGIAYRNKMDITKHLFWKHGTESAICKRCLNKRWPHVYHFCVPPQNFICEVCQHCFSKAMYLTVHKRIHVGDYRYPCTEENCEEKFISRKLLLKHAILHQSLETEKDDFKENNNVSEPPIVDAQLKHDLSDKHEDIKICDAEKIQEDSEAQNDQKIKEESDSCLQEQAQPIKEQNPAPSNASNTLEKIPQKKKKKKRSKELLEDLNLTAPNLSESGSSSDSESETKSKFEDEMPKVIPSPPSEIGDAKEQKSSEMDETENPEKVLDIWKNFLQAQQASGTDLVSSQIDLNLEDTFAEVPKSLHVCYSDHDYCKMFYPPQSSKSPQTKNRSKPKSVPDTPGAQSQQSRSSRNSNASSSSSDESSDTSSSSTCSCGSNCSCSGGSSSSSSSSSSENSDSSAASRKRQRKKSERNNRRKKSESVSPRKNHSVSEVLNASKIDENTHMQGIEETEKSNNFEKSEPLSESFINESDLETAESETDEEYYDEHPQKLASELLSQKRAQLIARTFLSPSHNFDIVENSRPSTPSLPEDVVYEKRKKKKKRERKSTSKSNILPPKFKINETRPSVSNFEGNTAANDMQQRQLDAIQSQYLALGNNLAEVTAHSFQPVSANMMEQSIPQQPHLTQLGNPRISEGSSCSDLDGSLKRSKRARRPNKFYGYTSDDESMGSSGLGQSLLIGMRTFKPQPPPQLVWNKEDLPAPSKSILNNKKTPRAQKRHDTDPYVGLSISDNERMHGSSAKKKKMGPSSFQSLNNKRNKKLPPIPRLKIRPALFGISNSQAFTNETLHRSLQDTSLMDGGSDRIGINDADDSSDVSSEDGNNQTWNDIPQPAKIYAQNHQFPQTSHQTSSLAPVPTPLPPTPQTTVFNHKIPPALLPNPDFATLQYFKANNIRYPIRPPAGARAAREGESVYCYCRCPYDEVSEMIACDGDNCLIEWFHFECVGIMVAPQGKWFCAECRPHYSEDLYPQTITPNLIGNLREQ